MRFRMCLVAIVLSSPVAPAFAQDGSAGARDSVNPRGAIRSVGRSVHRRHHRGHASGTKIPDYGGHLHRPADALPPGTTRPGPSRTFRPAR